MTRILLPDADLSTSLGFRPPVDGMAYYNVFNRSRDSLTRNLAPGGVAVLQGGYPTHGAGYSIFQGPGQYVEPQIGQSAGMTWFVVAKTPTSDTTTTPGAFIGTWDSASGTPAGCGIFPRATGIRGYAVADNSGLPVNMSQDLVADETTWRFLQLQINNVTPGVTALLIRDWTADLEATQEVAYSLRTHSRKLRVGAGYPASYTAISHINFAAAIDDVMTDTDAAKVYENAKALAALSSIPL